MNRITERIAWGIAGALGIAVVALLSGVVAAGPLQPPGPPTATQETWIYQPAGCFPVDIYQPGSYKLAGDINLGGCGVNGIEISSSDVSIDLNGFTVRAGGGPGSLAGIASIGAQRRITIKNGVVKGWGNGGVNLASSLYVTIDGVTASENTGPGFRTSTGARLSNCTAELNFNVSSGHGIQVGGGSLIEDCVAHNNAGAGILLDTPGAGSIVTNSTATDNLGSGILASQNGVTIEGATASGNALAGIQINGNRSIVRDSLADSNGTASGTQQGIGVLTGTFGSRIENNHSVNNEFGFFIAGTDTVVIGNSANGNTIGAFTIAPGNFAGTVVATEAAMNAATNSDVNKAVP